MMGEAQQLLWEGRASACLSLEGHAPSWPDATERVPPKVIHTFQVTPLFIPAWQALAFLPPPPLILARPLHSNILLLQLIRAKVLQVEKNRASA